MAKKFTDKNSSVFGENIPDKYIIGNNFFQGINKFLKKLILSEGLETTVPITIGEGTKDSHAVTKLQLDTVSSIKVDKLDESSIESNIGVIPSYNEEGSLTPSYYLETESIGDFANKIPASKLVKPIKDKADNSELKTAKLDESGNFIETVKGIAPENDEDLATKLYVDFLASTVSSGFLGSIAYNAIEPTPTESGYYVFTTSGTTLSWLGAVAVEKNDRAYVIAGTPNVWQYIPFQAIAASAVTRGTSNVDDDLTAVEEDIDTLKDKTQNLSSIGKIGVQNVVDEGADKTQQEINTDSYNSFIDLYGRVVSDKINCEIYDTYSINQIGGITALANIGNGVMMAGRNNPPYSFVEDFVARTPRRTVTYPGTVHMVGVGQTYTTISAAYAAASDGDVLQLIDGTYNTASESGGYLLINTWNKRVLIKGNAADNTAVVISQSASAPYCIRLRNATDIKFQDLTIQSNQESCVYIDGMQFTAGNIGVSALFDTCHLINTSNSAISCCILDNEGGSMTIYQKYFEFYNCTLTKTNGGAPANFNYLNNSPVYFELSTIYSDALSALTFDSGTKSNLILYNNKIIQASNNKAFQIGADTEVPINTNYMLDARMNQFSYTDTYGNHCVLLGRGCDKVYFINNVLFTKESTDPFVLGLGVKSRAITVGDVIIKGNYSTSSRPFLIKGAANCDIQNNTFVTSIENSYGMSFNNPNNDDGPLESTGNIIKYNYIYGTISAIYIYNTAGAINGNVSLRACTVDFNHYYSEVGDIFIKDDLVLYSFADRASFYGNNNDNNSIWGKKYTQLVKSTNYGRSWDYPITLPVQIQSISVNSLCYYGGLLFAGLGGDTTGITTGAVIKKSNDVGITWSTSLSSVQTNDINNKIIAITAMLHVVGTTWLAGCETQANGCPLLVSYNDGDTWSEWEDLNTNSNGLYRINSIAKIGNTDKILVTTSGSVKGEIIRISNLTSYSTVLSVSGILEWGGVWTDIKNVDNVVYVGSYDSTPVEGVCHPKIYKSINDGETFTTNLTTEITASTASIRCFGDFKNGIIAAFVSTNISDNTSTMYACNNGTWAALPLNIVENMGLLNIAISSDLGTVSIGVGNTIDIVSVKTVLIKQITL